MRPIFIHPKGKHGKRAEIDNVPPKRQFSLLMYIYVRCYLSTLTRSNALFKNQAFLRVMRRWLS